MYFFHAEQLSNGRQSPMLQNVRDTHNNIKTNSGCNGALKYKLQTVVNSKL